MHINFTTTDHFGNFRLSERISRSLKAVDYILHARPLPKFLLKVLRNEINKQKRLRGQCCVAISRSAGDSKLSRLFQVRLSFGLPRLLPIAITGIQKLIEGLNESWVICLKVIWFYQLS